MKPEEIYIGRVIDRIPGGPLRRQIELELRGHIADRLERGSSVEETLAQLGDPVALAESYVSALPLVRAPHLRRLAAKLTDGLIVVSIPAAVVLTGVLTTRTQVVENPLVIAMFFMAFVVTVISACLYTMIAEYLTGQTIGKHLFGLRVVTEVGTRISLGQSFLRQLPMFLQILTVDALFALFTAKRQRAFELVSRTRVVLAHERYQPVPATA